MRGGPDGTDGAIPPLLLVLVVPPTAFPTTGWLLVAVGLYLIVRQW